MAFSAFDDQKFNITGNNISTLGGVASDDIKTHATLASVDVIYRYICVLAENSPQ